MSRKLSTIPLDASKADLDRMRKHQDEANAAIGEIVQQQSVGKTGGKALRDAIRHREHHTRGMVTEIVRPRGVLRQLKEMK